jgi:hypothetical protein
VAAKFGLLFCEKPEKAAKSISSIVIDYITNSLEILNGYVNYINLS